MARLVKHHAAGPIKIEPQDKPVFVCGCGLTKNFPFCDGTHKICSAEAADKTYVYGDDRTVIEVRDDLPGAR
jgi:CDGSH-type Zn-finger protein